MSLVQLLRDHYQQCAHGPIIGVERAGTALGSDVLSPPQVAVGTNGTMLLGSESGAAPTRSSTWNRTWPRCSTVTCAAPGALLWDCACWSRAGGVALPAERRPAPEQATDTMVIHHPEAFHFNA